jgi:hypothetical protein
MTDAPSMTPEESYQAALGVTPDQGASGLETGSAPDQVVTPDATQAPDEQQTNATRINPSWEEAWKDVPEPIREQQRRVFEKWDNDFQELQARHRPFQEYEQAGITPTQLEQALQVQAALFEDPRAFYDRVGEAWGFKEQKADLQATAASGQTIDPSEYDDPAVRQMAETLAQQQAFIDQFQQQQLTQQQQYEQQQQEQRNIQWTANQMANLESQYGAIPDEDKMRVVERAILNANLGRNASVEVAFHELKREEADIIARAQRSAPRVLGGGAGAGQINNAPAPVDYSKETPEERLKRAMEVARNTIGSLNQAPQ